MVVGEVVAGAFPHAVLAVQAVHLVVGVLEQQAFLAREHRLVGHGRLALFGEHAGGKEYACVLAGQLRAPVGRGEREVAAHEAIASSRCALPVSEG